MRVVILLLPMLTMAVLAGCDRQSPPQGQAEPTKIEGTSAVVDRSHAGTAMPDLMLTGPEGKPLNLRSTIGKPVLVNLWATWCAPCIKEMPTLDALQAARGDGLLVVPVSQDQRPELVAPFWKKRGYKSITPWLDPDARMSEETNGGSLPATIFYDVAGKEVWRVLGDLDWMGAEATTLMAETSPAKAR